VRASLKNISPYSTSKKTIFISTGTLQSLRMAEIQLARRFRKKETWAEKIVWRWLRDRRFSGYKFRRQHPLGDYYLDFFCEEAELNIELDGGQHGFPSQRARDVEREKFLQSRGIKTLRFWNSYLRANGQSVRDTIFEELQNGHHILCRSIPGR